MRWKLLLLLATSCSDAANAERTWVVVASGTSLVGNGVTNVGVDRQDHFIGTESTLGLVTSGNPTSAWQATPPFGNTGVTTWFGTSKNAPLVNKDGKVWQSTPTGWVERGAMTKPGSYQIVIDADDRGALYVLTPSSGLARYSNDTLEALPTMGGALTHWVTRTGRVFSLNTVTSPGEIFEGTTALLGGRGCPNNDVLGCMRAIFPMGVDHAGSLYVTTRSVSANAVVWAGHKYVGNAWQDLPRFPSLVESRNLNCAVAGNGSLYCQRFGPESPDGTIGPANEIMYLAPNGSSWSSIGTLPTTERYQGLAPDFQIAARNDGRLAITCCALGNGNDSLWVSDR